MARRRLCLAFVQLGRCVADLERSEFVPKHAQHPLRSDVTGFAFLVTELGSREEVMPCAALAGFVADNEK